MIGAEMGPEMTGGPIFSLELEFFDLRLLNSDGNSFDLRPWCGEPELPPEPEEEEECTDVQDDDTNFEGSRVAFSGVVAICERREARAKWLSASCSALRAGEDGLGCRLVDWSASESPRMRSKEVAVEEAVMAEQRGVRSSSDISDNSEVRCERTVLGWVLDSDELGLMRPVVASEVAAASEDILAAPLEVECELWLLIRPLEAEEDGAAEVPFDAGESSIVSDLKMSSMSPPKSSEDCGERCL